MYELSTLFLSGAHKKYHLIFPEFQNVFFYMRPITSTAIISFFILLCSAFSFLFSFRQRPTNPMNIAFGWVYLEQNKKKKNNTKLKWFFPMWTDRPISNAQSHCHFSIGNHFSLGRWLYYYTFIRWLKSFQQINELWDVYKRWMHMIKCVCTHFWLSGRCLVHGYHIYIFMHIYIYIYVHLV